MTMILVVDDVKTERSITVAFLRKAGYSVIEAASAEESYLIASTKNPALILMDVVMLPVSGFEATRKLSKDPVTKNIPIIMCTSKTKPTDKIWAEKQGASGYLTKPITESRLLSTVKKVLA